MSREAPTPAGHLLVDVVEVGVEGIDVSTMCILVKGESRSLGSVTLSWYPSYILECRVVSVLVVSVSNLRKTPKPKSR